jgi:hypothetical protein
MTEVSHLKVSDNVVTDALSRYPEETGQSYDHLLPDEHDMDLVCAHSFNLSSGLIMDEFGSLSQDDTLPHVDASFEGNGALTLYVAQRIRTCLSPVYFNTPPNI